MQVVVRLIDVKMKGCPYLKVKYSFKNYQFNSNLYNSGWIVSFNYLTVQNIIAGKQINSTYYLKWKLNV